MVKWTGRDGRIFAKNNSENDPPFLSTLSRGDIEVDTPDGTVRQLGLGPYEIGGPRGRITTQGAAHPKSNVGNAGGKAQTLRVK